MNFFNFFYVFEKKSFKPLKNEYNFTNFECFCNKIPYHTQEFPGWLNVYSLNFFFKNVIFINVKKNWKNHVNSEKAINSFEMKKDLIIYWTIIF